ncbi:adenine glycosylase [uncultured Olegusella sp.]|uniref:adenine glycosylase n=1 Tax=uncultured Olegusella sp. TaxID=1979846 RepID=UPI00262D5A54|nr:adenine glycosylase [uncultured Olegusella sp.]
MPKPPTANPSLALNNGQDGPHMHRALDGADRCSVRWALTRDVTPPTGVAQFDAAQLAEFRIKVLAKGRELYRDLPWRRTRDPYATWLSEVMLQQTQVVRVDGRWQKWLERFPNVEALAVASVADVLEEWQGMGYNRRALSLQKAAQMIVHQGGKFPYDLKGLLALPGVGPATAAGIRAFAWGLPGIYLETNVRTVFLHELFPHELDVPDKKIAPLVEQTCPPESTDEADNPRSWYYALLDYGAFLKANLPNPSRRSRSHVKQSRFEGSHRQKRAALIRLLLKARGGNDADVTLLTKELSKLEEKAGRLSLDVTEVTSLLQELEGEGFCYLDEGRWHV